MLGVNVGSFAVAGRIAVTRVFLEAVEERIELPPVTGPAWAKRWSTSSSVSAARFLNRPRSPGTPQWALSEAAAVTTAWATEEFGDVDAPGEVPVVLGFTMCRTPS